jgi:small subunit ribosomal protein S18
MSDEPSDTPTEKRTPPSGPAAGGDAPPRAPRSGPAGPAAGPSGPSGPSGPVGDRGAGGGGGGGYGGGPPSDRGPRPPRSDRGDRDDRDRPPRAPLTVKGRLRAAARKKARKSAKKKGMFQRRKVCRFCADKNLVVSYKDVKTLRLFITETGKMTPRRISGTCAKHQRPLAQEIKRARQLAMLPYAPSHF